MALASCKHVLRSIPGSGRSPGEGNGFSLQYSCPENSVDRGVWRATVHGVAKSQARLSGQHFHFSHVHLELMSVLADVIKVKILRWEHPITVNPNSNMDILIKDRKGDIQLPREAL